MSVIRVNKTKDYSVMSNIHLKDKNLSLKAKGLLSVMLSLPDNWKYTVDGIVAICKENETSVNSALKELKELKYLKVTKLLPNETESGRIEYVYDVFEIPKQEDEKQDLENLGVENLGVEFLGVENHPLYKNTNILNTNKENIDLLNTNICKRFNKPSLQDVQEYINDKGYHFSAEDFINHYEAVGWKVGKSPMKDWKACCRTWESNYLKNPKNKKAIENSFLDNISIEDMKKDGWI